MQASPSAQRTAFPSVISYTHQLTAPKVIAKASTALGEIASAASLAPDSSTSILGTRLT